MIDSDEVKPLLKLNVAMQYPRDDAIDMRFQDDISSPSMQTNITSGKGNTVMTSSAGSALDDSTPSDSGVQLMDSMSSDMNESFMSNFGLDYDGNYSTAIATPALSEACKQIYGDEFNGVELISPLPDVVMAIEPIDAMANVCGLDDSAMTRSDIDNSNLAVNNDIPDEMKTSICSTFDTDAIVFRRKVKKTRTNSNSSNGGSVKKRVSFHEDILKNTRTDNIHIEHGFITYKGHPKKVPYRYLRNSWCSQGQCDDYADEAGSTCYRNACSDVLDYGQMDVFEHNDITDSQWTDSGVFEYAKGKPKEQQQKHAPIRKAASNDDRTLYQCKCSDSDSNSDSTEHGDDARRSDYSRTKSSSCDCIERNQSNRLNNNDAQNMTDQCYYSEPCFETMDESDGEGTVKKSVWCKELKPKSSCLKKTRCDTAVILEHDVGAKVKKFNVHQLPDVNNLFGSLKNIFTISMPERGVPEGCEDLHNVVECVPDSPMKSVPEPMKLASPCVGRIDTPNDSPTTSKRKAALSLFTIPFEEEMAQVAIADDTIIDSSPSAQHRPNTFRNKFIVNCESTVFEHTGVFVENRDPNEPIPDIPNSSSNCVTPQKQSKSILSFATAPFKQKLSNIFSSFRDLSNSTVSTTSTTTTPSPRSASIQQEQLQAQLKKFQAEQMSRSWNSSYDYQSNKMSLFDADASMTSSIISNSSDKQSIMSSSTMTTSTNTTSNQERVENHHILTAPKTCEVVQPSTSTASSPKKTRHLSSPMHRKSSTSTFDRAKLSPDLFCGQKSTPANPMILLSEEFDDLLTVTTTTSDMDITENDIEIVDYTAAVDEANSMAAQLKAHDQRKQQANQFLRPPSSKSSLINRFLRNVTQKKITDATIKKNIIMSYKYKDAPKPFSNLYVKPKQPITQDALADFNAEIALEMQAHELCVDEVEADARGPEEELHAREDICIGVGEVSVDLFDIGQLHILRDDTEKLIKVFKLYTGYTLHGHMTPVLVFLTDKTLYVTDLVRNRLCNKFVLPYSELDIILIGPHGNTVLLSNSARDMQQVLLAGGPYPADGLVSSLEMCARRAGTKLPAVGQLTFDHLAPLQKFVQENCSVSKNDAWIYYAVVSVPANILTYEDEPLGPSVKGPLMHRTMPLTGDQSNQQWSAGYFLLKAGVLYMFSDANKKLPAMAVAISECKCARRVVSSQRPHCFEIMLKTSVLQLAAPDEYVASEWLQAVVQSASGLFEHQERHKTLGCTLVITTNHLITLREDFSSPLRRLNSKGAIEPSVLPKPQHSESFTLDRKMSISTMSDSTMNDVCSNLSTSTRRSDLGSNRSSPMRPPRTSSSTEEKSFTSISSIYGKNAGVAIKTCASLQEMISVRIPPHNDQWWCILEFSCQEVRDCSDDMVIFFATNSDMRRFLSILETVWHSKNNSPFPQSILSDTDTITSHGSNLFSSLNRAWEPLLASALGYPH